VLVRDQLDPKRLNQLSLNLVNQIHRLVKFVPLDIAYPSGPEIQNYPSRNQRSLNRMKLNRAGALLEELISDHLPIQMQCQTK